jgi:hypothetical protein
MEDYQKILELLLTLDGSKKINEGQIKMHCPICNKPDNKLYVGLTHNPYYTSKGIKALGYGCKQCQFSGMVGKKFFQVLGLQYDKNLIKFNINRNNILKNVNSVTKMQKLDLKIPNFIRPEDEFKVKYLEGRFGRKITIKDIIHYKIVLNFNDLFEYNKMSLYEYEDKSDKERCRKLKYMADEYTKHFVGLLSVDNNKVNLRNINSQKFANKRYMVHVINKNIGNPYMYMPSSELNLLSLNPVINMAEGNYDIIGAKELYFPDERNDMVFVAIGTRTAYKRALNQIFKMTGWLNASVNVFADNDKDTNLDWYREMFKEWRPLLDRITINYNVAVDKDGKPCKDFGNLSNPVQLEVHEI